MASPVRRLAALTFLLALGCSGPVPSPTPLPDPQRPPEVATVEIDGWTARCDGVDEAECVGVMRLFVNNLARNHAWVKDQSESTVTVTWRPGPCLPRSQWAADGRCWQAEASVDEGPICMVVARQKPGLSELGYGQAGGDEMSGNAAAGPGPRRPACI